jgi:CubicO group peptidase (beta-lactamase class C family)
MAVEIQRNEIFRTPGRFGWDGGLGTSAYTYPAEGMIGILFTQRNDGFAGTAEAVH